MTQRKSNPTRTVILAAILLLSCAGPGTDLTRKHLDEGYRQKPVSDILVIGIADRDDMRRLFEDRFVASLKAQGVDAVGSAEAVDVAPDLKLEKEQIARAVDAHGSDAVIITHLVDLEQKASFVRRSPSAVGYYGYYGMLHSYYSDPGVSAERTTVWLETNLYDVATEALIWSAESKSWNVASDRQLMQDVIHAVVRDLIQTGVAAPR